MSLERATVTAGLFGRLAGGLVIAVAAGGISLAAAQTGQAERTGQAEQTGQTEQTGAAQTERTERTGQTGPAHAPADVVERLHTGLVELSAKSDQASLEQRIERLRPLITATHDLAYIAELTIRREWGDLSASERERFVDAFERLSIATYAGRFADLERDPFRVRERHEPDGGRARVSAEIDTRDGEPIPLDYVLAERDGRWKIINIVADGVSDLALKRAEYRRILADGNMDDLVAELEAQVDALR